jgi:hypothetical protein
MRRTLLLSILIGALGVSAALAQFGGRVNEVVLYVVTAKGSPDPQIVPANTVNTATGFTVIDPTKQTPIQFGSSFPGESYVPLHLEADDNLRFIIQKEGIVTQHNEFLGAGKLMIVKGIDRLLIPNKAPINLTAGLYAPFPAGVDFGPERPLLEANSYLWTAVPFFPLIVPKDPSFTSPLDPPGLTGSEYVLSLGQFDTLIPWVGWYITYPNVGWPEGIDARLIDSDSSVNATVRMIRLRPGKKTPPFLINANTHIAVLQGSVQITPTNNGTTTTLTQFQYAFIPNGFAITLSNPIPYTGPTGN